VEIVLRHFPVVCLTGWSRSRAGRTRHPPAQPPARPPWRAACHALVSGAPIAVISASLLVGCTLLPRDGPPGAIVRDTAEVQVQNTGGLSFALVNLGPQVVERAGRSYIAPGFSRLFNGMAGAPVRVGVNDTIAVTIFEARGGGLFVPSQETARAGNFVQIPVQQVDQRGTISIPFAGEVPVVGRNARQIGEEIQERLKNQAVDPQVVVTINERKSSQVSVLGEVYTPNKFSMDPSGIRVLDAIARAGGARHPAFESVVTVKRGRVRDQALLTTIVADPKQNISLLSGDVVYVSREPRIFLTFGATPPPGSIGGQNNRRFIFEDENLSLAEGVAKAGGLESARADPQSVFLFRLERRELLERIGVDVSRYPERLVPTVFVVDLRTPDGFFLANNFYMQHRDIIFVSEAPTTDLTKFLNILKGMTSPGVDIATTIQRLSTL
jgi:polysaccharide biosynthesis/export protein